MKPNQIKQGSPLRLQRIGQWLNVGSKAYLWAMAGVPEIRMRRIKKVIGIRRARESLCTNPFSPRLLVRSIHDVSSDADP